ncbi:uncharacterized protein B0H18DRAFT_1019793 [Fomitopsis serialis]|uniref:uncharacterized protein n=1 Tax=Fomitopsis serialis TaxID=139415 RepID=UPI002008DB4D|nr:uncharacterized protein B0H18DRAFT_1019793 [Neoantrodia serialis]KAH9921909.1 hypothetical protein B0H18DRAFT_1019793 [Neoantrodia serialis]
MFAFGAIATLFTASVSAIPALNTRQTGASCAGFGSGSTDTPTYNFTLTAHNTTLPNTNSTGAPLVLGWGPPGTSSEASYWAISTYAEWHSNQWPYFSLEAYDYDIASGAEVGFIVLPTDPGRDVPKIYCAALRDDYVMLAVNNDADSFSLCQAVPDPRPNNVLVYQANADNSQTYDYSTCYGVDVYLIPYYG